MNAAIEAAGLRKSFGRTRALNGLDLNVAAGEVHGFLGPNGAGKTTAIRILLGLVRADGGSARLLGADPWRDAVGLHRRLAYVPGDVTLWPSLSGGEVIDLLGRLHGGLDRKRRQVLLERFELDPSKKARAYSKGNRQKVALVAALASGAELLIMDEPTAGLDPLMESVFRECVSELRLDGTTVLLSSHILSEVEALCDRVTIIRAGRAVEAGALADLRHLTRTSIDAQLSVPAGGDAATGDAATGDTATGDAATGDTAGPALAGLAGLAGVHGLTVEGTRVRCQVESGALDEVLRRLTSAGLRSLLCQPPTLEELFLRHYGANGQEALR